jgi:RNA polymerase sigma factor (sigma-70 family)
MPDRLSASDVVTAPDAAVPGNTPGRDRLSPAEREFARELFENHRLSLYRYLSRLLRSREEASEILQETYLRLLRQPSFEHVRANARAYLFQTATNLARDFFRYRAIRGIDAEKRAYGFASAEIEDWTNLPDLALEGDQLATTIIQALGELNPPTREALLLYRFRDMTHRDIALRMRVSTRTVERYVREGLAHIERRLEELL